MYKPDCIVYVAIRWGRLWKKAFTFFLYLMTAHFVEDAKGKVTFEGLLSESEQENVYGFHAIMWKWTFSTYIWWIASQPSAFIPV